MCHADESRPPAPPEATSAVADAGELRLTSADGATFLVYRAVPETPTGAGVVLLPDVRGAHEFYRDLARRFASTGVAALVVDYYGRIAEDDVRGPDFDGFTLVQKLDRERTQDDIVAAVDHLVSGALGPVTAAFTVGFCVGGAMSWAQSALQPRLAGVVGFYGRPAECRELIGAMTRPLLVLGAGADVLTTVEDNRAFDVELSEAGVPHEFTLYEGAPHSFFDGALPDQAENAADAWARVSAFLRAHT